MLRFFRKHQRVFFIIVIIFIIVSFLFAGTLSPFLTSEEVKDEVIGKTVDGSDLSKREVDELVYFLSAAAPDSLFSGKNRTLNLLNDDVVRKDFLATGLGETISNRFFDKLKPELDEKLLKVRNSNFYVHPEAPEISAVGVWQQFQPEAFQVISLLRSAKAADQNFLGLLSRLCVQQLNLPSEMVRRVLFYQQNQRSAVRPDESLNYANLHLFGFETIEDWLGRGYLQLISEYIINAAKVAEKRGLSISNDEARTELLKNLQKGLATANIKESPTYEDAKAFFGQQLRMLGFDEGRAIKLWKKVMLMRRLSADVGRSMQVDSLPFNAFSVYANEGAEVEEYSPADSLRLRNFRSLLKYQYYVEGVMGVSRSSLYLPRQLPSVQEVEKRAPELVRRQCKLEWREVKKEAVAQRITIKETWQWQGEDKNWQTLQAQFPQLSKEQTRSAAGRMALLDSLNPKERLKIDQFTRIRIVDAHPEWIADAFERAPIQRVERGVRLKGEELPFLSTISAAALIEKLSETSTLSLVSADEESLYRIKSIEIAPQNEILTFITASSDGTLDRLVDARLEEAYPEIRKKNPSLFQLSNGEWKPLQSVSDQVGALLYAPLLKAIEEEWKQTGHTLSEKEGNQPLEFYATRRHYAWMREMRARVISSPEDQSLIQTGSSFEDQWKLKKSQRSIRKWERSPFSKEEVLALPQGGWSSVGVGFLGELGFCKMKGRTSATELTQEEKNEIQENLSRETSRKFMGELLNQMIEKRAIGENILPNRAV